MIPPSDASSLATRASLLSRVRDVENADGWREFFDRYRELIRRLALRSGLGDSEADDVLQETMGCLAKQLPEFLYDPARGSFKGWLSTIVRRRVVDQFRKRRPELSLDDTALECHRFAPSDTAPDPWEQEWREHVLREASGRVRSQVAPRQFQMFDLFALQGMPMSDVCRALAVNAAQVYMAKMRVGAIFRKEAAEIRRELGEV